MKMIKSILTVFTILTVTTFATAQSVEKTFVKSFNLQGNNIVILDLNGDVEVKEWDNKLVRVQMTVSLESSSTNILKALLQAGRYNLKSNDTEDGYVINMPGMQKEIKGRKLGEKVKYLIYAPSDVLVKMQDSASTSTDSAAEVMSSAL